MSKIIKISDKLLIFIESHRKFKQESYSDIIERELEFDEDFIETLKKFQKMNIPLTNESEDERLKSRREIVKKQFKKGEFKCLRCGIKWRRKSELYNKSCRHCHKNNWFVGENYPCEICEKIVWSPEIHHIDRDRQNNNPDNLLVVCMRCHKRIHGEKTRNFHGIDIKAKKRIIYYLNKCIKKDL